MSKIIYSPSAPYEDEINFSAARGTADKKDGRTPPKRIFGLFALFAVLCAVSVAAAAVFSAADGTEAAPADEGDAAAEQAVIDSISDAQAMHEAEIDALIARTEAVVQRLQDLDDSESMIREQVGLDSSSPARSEIPVAAPGGVGGPSELHYAERTGMSLNEKIDYAEYLVRYADVYTRLLENKLNALSTSIDEYYRYLPHVWPVSGERRRITSYFGWRSDPITGEGREFHSGIDISDSYGSDIFASAAGTVITAEFSSGYGYNILIDHGNGYSTRYSHCSELLVNKGDFVEQGELIAYMGSSGRSTGSHCDFRIYCDGCALDPLDMLD